jgi:hypothetical protein
MAQQVDLAVVLAQMVSQAVQVIVEHFHLLKVLLVVVREDRRLELAVEAHLRLALVQRH